MGYNKKIKFIFVFVFLVFSPCFSNSFAMDFSSEDLIQRADAGNAEAQYTLASIYKFVGDYSKAKTYFEKAADQGHSLALYFLVRNYIDKYKVNLGKCFLIIESLREVRGRSVAECEKYVELLENQLDTLTQAADAGNLESQYALARVYKLMIKHTRVKDSVAALAYFKKAEDLKRACSLDDPIWLGRLGVGYECFNVEQTYLAAEKFYKPKADGGDPEAQYNLARVYLRFSDSFFSLPSDIRYRNLLNFLNYMNKAGNQGHLPALLQLADQVKDRKTYYENAENLCIKAAEKGNISDLIRLLQHMQNNNYNSSADAEKYFMQAVEQGDPEALFIQGERYFRDNNFAEGVKYCKQAADKGYLRAQNTIANIYPENIDACAPIISLEEVITYLKNAAKINYHTEAMEALGFVCCIENDLFNITNKDLADFRLAAQKGFVWPLIPLGKMYRKIKDFQKALNYYEVAANATAERISSRAKYAKAKMYLKGQGVEKNFEKAVQLFNDATKGYSNANLILGDLYYEGTEIPKDYKKAIKCYDEFLRSNSVGEKGLYCRYRMAQMYLSGGNGLEVDYKKALEEYANVLKLTAPDTELYNIAMKDIEEFCKNHLKPADEKGALKAVEALIKIYSEGIGLQQNFTEVLKYFKLAVEKKHEWGEGKKYEWEARQQSDKFRYSLGKTCELYCLPAAEKDDPTAQIIMGIACSENITNPENIKDVLKCYKRAAKDGNLKCQGEVIETYLFGRHGVAKNVQQAAKYLHLRYQAKECFLFLGDMWLTGKLVTREFSSRVSETITPNFFLAIDCYYKGLKKGFKEGCKMTSPLGELKQLLTFVKGDDDLLEPKFDLNRQVYSKTECLVHDMNNVSELHGASSENDEKVLHIKQLAPLYRSFATFGAEINSWGEKIVENYQKSGLFIVCVQPTEKLIQSYTEGSGEFSFIKLKGKIYSCIDGENPKWGSDFGKFRKKRKSVLQDLEKAEFALGCIQSLQNDKVHLQQIDEELKIVAQGKKAVEETCEYLDDLIINTVNIRNRAFRKENEGFFK